MNIETSTHKKKITGTFLIFGLIVWLSVAVVIFVENIKENEVHSIENMLEEVTKNNANAVENIFEKYINFLLLLASNFQNEDFSLENSVESIIHLKKYEDFISVYLSFPDDNERYKDNKYNKKMNNKEIFVTDIYYDRGVQKEVVSVNVPIIDGKGRFIAYLIGLLDVEALSTSFNKTFYDVGGYYYIIDSNGNYVSFSNSNQMLAVNINFEEAVGELQFFDGYFGKDVLNAFKLRSEGILKYTDKHGKQERLAYYTPIEINDWIMYVAIPQEQITDKIDTNLNSMFILIINIVAIFTILTFWIYRSQKTMTALAQEKEKQFRLIAEQTNKYIMEWDFTTNEVHFTGAFLETVDKPTLTNSMYDDLSSGFIYEEDVPNAITAVEKLKRGEFVIDLKLRVRGKNGNYIWFLLSGYPIKEHIGRREVVNKAIGFIENIDEEEKEIALLREMSELDSLTKIYNKGTTELLIKRILANSKTDVNKHCLLTIDLDNFKAINDTFGHQFGDEVIIESARYLKSLFRHNDIVGRIGGDEFFVFMKDTVSEQLVLDKCEQICTFFHKEYQNEGNTVEVSSSIGIALYPLHGSTFEELYKCSDIALYHAKREGKNTYQFYKGNVNITQGKENEFRHSGTTIESAINKDNALF